MFGRFFGLWCGTSIILWTCESKYHNFPLVIILYGLINLIGLRRVSTVFKGCELGSQGLIPHRVIGHHFNTVFGITECCTDSCLKTKMWNINTNYNSNLLPFVGSVD
jgi:hypothetical protein